MNNLFGLIRIKELMNITKGSKDIKIGLIDGPVQAEHKNLVKSNITLINSDIKPKCLTNDSIACKHGTFIAGILCGNRDSETPGICPQCPLIVRPVFPEETVAGKYTNSNFEELTKAVNDIINAGAKIINLSLGIAKANNYEFPALKAVLDFAYKKGVLVFAAAGNHGNIGVIPLISHPWIIPVTACDINGIPYKKNNLGITIGKRGIMAPGVDISSAIPEDKLSKMSGTSVAVPFVAGTAALLWSLYPKASAYDIHKAILKPDYPRKSIIPPLLDGMGSYISLKQNNY
ncbi:MAG: S8 family serine peptidase [Bacillota bacterium]|nr:S8 family serine peptidase [Bacillota bacterium]